IGPSGTSVTLPTFSWNAVTGADHYDIWVQDMSTGQVLRNTNVAGTAWTPSSPLVEGDTYHWWVRPVTGLGGNALWSEYMSITVAALGAPTLVGPSGWTALQPAFSWNAVTGADHYDIWVQDMSTGQVLRNKTVTGTSWTATSALVAGDSYQWWVRAVDN